MQALPVCLSMFFSTHQRILFQAHCTVWLLELMSALISSLSYVSSSLYSVAVGVDVSTHQLIVLCFKLTVLCGCWGRCRLLMRPRSIQFISLLFSCEAIILYFYWNWLIGTDPAGSKKDKCCEICVPLLITSSETYSLTFSWFIHCLHRPSFHLFLIHLLLGLII